MKPSNILPVVLRRPRPSLLAAIIALSTLSPQLPTLFAQGTPFTYQGRLNDGVNLASGIYDLRFTVYDAAGGGSAVGGPLTIASTTVSNGLFTVALDFGAAVFSGAPRWLQIEVGTNGSPVTPLVPRQAITPTPYAITALTVPSGSITAAQIAPGAIGAGQLAPGAAADNLGANGLNGVPSGGVVLSELEVNPAFLDAGYVPFGGEVTVSGDVWANIPPGPPASGLLSSGRYGHKAVWTGSEMLVIGGTPISDGLRYNPTGNAWTLMSKSNAPAIGASVQVAWTGSRMLVWDAYHRVGGRYNPNTDAWQPMSEAGAPGARAEEAAVFADGYFIIWGGRDVDDENRFLRSGARYKPANDTWTALPLTGAPVGRAGPGAIATATEAIFFGGRSTNYHYYIDPQYGGRYVLIPYAHPDGGRYNVAANSWSSMADAPAGRTDHTATWSGTYLYVWGGLTGYSYTCLFGCGVEEFRSDRGMRYNPATDNWSFLPTDNQPCAASIDHTAVWNGANLIVWGGRCDVPGDGLSGLEKLKSGARFNQASGTWVPIADAPGAARDQHSAVWTGTQMIVWGGQDRNDEEMDAGARYTPSGDTWASTSIPPGSGEPSERTDAATVWGGGRLMVWGGRSGATALRSGGVFRTGSGWSSIPERGAPSARTGHTAVWSGKEMIVWGGFGGFGAVPLNNGGRFNVSSNRWFPIATANAPRARANHTAVWTGTEMIVWGGYDFTNFANPTYLFNGASYNPSNNTWTTLPNLSFLPGRASQTALWTGSEMLIWGGNSSPGFLSPPVFYDQGFGYDPVTRLWRFLPSSGLSARSAHTAVWTGDEMLIWGGIGASGVTNTGARYHPGSNVWAGITTDLAPIGRNAHTAVWGDHRMIVWGGQNLNGPLATGALYDPFADKWATMTNSPPGARTGHGAVWTGTRMIVVNGAGDNDEFGENVGDNRAFTPRKTLYYYQKP